MEFTNWEPRSTNLALEPVDDVDEERRRHATARSIPRSSISASSRANGLRVPMTRGTLLLGCCRRFDLMKEHAGIDVQALYPGRQAAQADASWTWDAFLAAAEKCQKAGMRFGLPLGVTTDTDQWVGALFLAYGARADGCQGQHHRQVGRGAPGARVRQAAGRLPARRTPPAWDDASNNKWLISGKGALIFNPPSAWAVGQARCAAGRGEVLDARLPQGTEGPVQSDPAALLRHLELLQEQGRRPRACSSTSPSRAERREAGRREPGLRHAALPEVQRLQDLGRGGSAQGHALALSEQGRRPGGRRHLLAGPAADRRADLGPGDPGRRWSSATSKGEPMEKTLDWAERELEGFKRT